MFFLKNHYNINKICVRCVSDAKKCLNESERKFSPEFLANRFVYGHSKNFRTQKRATEMRYTKTTPGMRLTVLLSSDNAAQIDAFMETVSKIAKIVSGREIQRIYFKPLNIRCDAENNFLNFPAKNGINEFFAQNKFLDFPAITENGLNNFPAQNKFLKISSENNTNFNFPTENGLNNFPAQNKFSKISSENKTNFNFPAENILFDFSAKNNPENFAAQNNTYKIFCKNRSFNFPSENKIPQSSAENEALSDFTTENNASTFRKSNSKFPLQKYMRIIEFEALKFDSINDLFDFVLNNSPPGSRIAFRQEPWQYLLIKFHRHKNLFDLKNGSPLLYYDAILDHKFSLRRKADRKKMEAKQYKNLVKRMRKNRDYILDNQRKIDRKLALEAEKNNPTRAEPIDATQTNTTETNTEKPKLKT